MHGDRIELKYKSHSSQLQKDVCSFFVQMDVEAHIRSVMDEIMTSEAERNNLSEADLIEKLRNRGVVDEIMNHLHFSGTAQASRPATHILDVDDQVTHGAVKKGKGLMSR